MKRVINLILIASIVCCNVLITYASDVSETKIISPANGEWIDPYKTTTVTWAKLSSDVDYKITIKNERTGKYIVQNKSVEENSYSIKSNVLDFEERYVIWVGTYNGSQAMGKGDSITVNVVDRNSSRKKYEEAEFIYPSNDQEVPADRDLRIAFSGDSELAYNLTVKDTTSGKTIVNELGLTKDVYTVKRSLLTEGHYYKAWVGTYKKASVEQKQLGAGNEVVFKIEKTAEIKDPERPVVDTTVDNSASQRPVVDTTEEVSRPQRPVVDTTEEVSKPQRPSVDTGNNSQVVKEAIFSYPDNDDVVSYNRDLRITWNNHGAETCYELTIKDVTDNTYITKKELVTGISYKIKASKLKQRHRYKMWLGTYSSNAADKKLIGNGDTIYFDTDGMLPLEINTHTAELNNLGLLFKYDITGDNFGYATVKVTDKKGNVVYSGMDYNIRSDIFVDINKLEYNNTYICEIEVYNANGEKCGYKSQEYRYEREKGVYPDISSIHKNYSAIRKLSLDGIFEGDEYGNFRPDDSITRAEFVKVVCSAFKLVKKSGGKIFRDTATHWASEFIYNAASNGLISGVNENNFAPDEKITYQQISKIIIILKGWDSNADKLGGYPDGYVKVMINNNLFENSNIKTDSFVSSQYYERNATRADVAQIVYNAILCGDKDKTLVKSGNEIPLVNNSESAYVWPINTLKDFSSHRENGFVHDISATVGTELYAIEDGTIECFQAYTYFTDIEYLTSYGNFIKFTSDDGKTKAVYAHLNSFAKCKGIISSDMTKAISGNTDKHFLGQYKVTKGEVIGYSGNTGNSTGPHLHFELEINGTRVDVPDYIHPYDITTTSGNDSENSALTNQYKKINTYSTPLTAWTIYADSANYLVPMYSACDEKSTIIANSIASVECNILEFYDNGWCKVRCAYGIGYVQSYRFILKYGEQQPYKKEIFTNGIIKVNKRISDTSDYGTISKSEDSPLTVVSDNGNAFQIMYKVTGTSIYKMGWVDISTFNKVENSDVQMNLRGYRDSYVPLGVINEWSEKYSISRDSNAYNALLSINSRYEEKIVNKNGVNVFVFEGVGTNAAPDERFNAMCVVVKDCNIIYLNLNSTTLPDRPFDPECNADDNTPTLISGVYNFSTVNHKGYASINVNGARVVRFESQYEYTDKTKQKPSSSGINVHRRTHDYIHTNGVGNSAGCLNIGKAGSDSSSEYAKFIQAIGIVPKNSRGDASYTTFVSGQIVVDRFYAQEYLEKIGYPEDAIKMIIGN